MKLYKVYIDNGAEYEDYDQVDFLIAANSLVEATNIAIELYKKDYFWREIGEITVTEVSKTSNGVPIKAVERK